MNCSIGRRLQPDSVTIHTDHHFIYKYSFEWSVAANAALTKGLYDARLFSRYHHIVYLVELLSVVYEK